jgi:Alginate export
MEGRRLFRRLAGVGLLAWLCLNASPALYAGDESLPPLGTLPPPVSRSAQSLPTPAPFIVPPASPADEKAPPPPPDALPPASPPSPAPAGESKPSDPGAAGQSDYWAKVPPVQPLQRPGWFPIFPTGEGYYSLADQVHGEWRKSPPKYPYPRFSIIPQPFFDVDWRYLDDPKNTDHDYFDCLKRIRIGDDCMLFTTGGEFRARYNYEENSRLLNTGPIALRGRDNTYDLYRLRAYGDLMITNRFRVFVEAISATSPDATLVPQGIDVNKADLQNAFVDVATIDVDNSPVWLRVGRQELCYGSQRLVSALDWANTRRTFQGVKAFWQSEHWAVDAFLVQPIPVAPNVVGVRNQNLFDSVDNNQVFAGLWTTYRPNKNQAIDFYDLYLDNTNAATFQTLGPGNRTVARTKPGANSFNTIGSRWVGDDNGWLWDVEGMLQFGGFYDSDMFAGAFTAGGGYQWKEAWGTPMAWLYYDYASGTGTPGQDGPRNTFNQLFPFGHYYFGFIDVVGRRNINDVAAIFTIWPEKWLFTQLQIHNFWLAQGRDALYNAGGLPIRQDVTGRAGRTVGSEVDLLFNFHLSNHSDVLLSYSYLAAGRFIRQTATTESGRDNPQALYVQYSYRW